jgi:lysophospholipid acyltransferase (LPLAT)-like uncharacterized protein
VVATSTVAESKPQLDARGFSLAQRLALFCVSWIGYLALRLIGPTLRWKVEIEAGGPAAERCDPVIIVFWHRCVFPGTWRYRRRGIAVMTSSSFDGEYIARIIERCGYSAVRGSSSRGGVRALLGMHKILEQGRSVGFTIDGPRGPRYVAKPGPVLLARNTGAPIYSLHVALEKAWVFDSWDLFMVPKPFSRALLRLGRLIHVPPDATPAQMQQYQAEMQATLDRIRDDAERQMIAAAGRNA